METTIAVRESTAQLLAAVKERMHARSMDETIVRILQKNEGIPKSGFGARPKLKIFSEKERAEFHEL